MSQDEQDRLDGLHRILREVSGDQIVLLEQYFPPSEDEEPAVLDCGYGNGSWVDAMIEEYDCEVR